MREHLARVCRMQGNVVQSGRWGYLAQERDPAEVAAFEKATACAVKRMQALQWRSAPDTASTAISRERLKELLDEARQQTGKRTLQYETLSARDWQPPSSAAERLGTVAALTIPLTLLALFIIGVIDGLATVISWLR